MKVVVNPLVERILDNLQAKLPDLITADFMGDLLGKGVEAIDQPVVSTTYRSTLRLIQLSPSRT